MTRRKSNKQPVEEDGFSRQLLSLSLFVVLLAFFIVLNGVSTFDEGKVRDTMSSVGFAFGTKIEAISGFDGEEASQTESEEGETGEGSVFERMQALFNANIPGNKAVLSRSQGVLHVALPLEEFEQSVAATLQAEGRLNDGGMSDYMIDTLIALMNREDEGVTYRMDIMYNMSDSPAEMLNSSPQELRSHLIRAGALAADIEKIGLPEGLMSIALSKGNPAIVDLFFRIHEVHEVDVDGSGSQ